ncbi:hypothetical protein TrLO_g3854 [Triparma laevis f. longispina]|nr:hypothetical protein TrLO_g3854 [Triparma laevis f. longispina]
MSNSTTQPPAAANDELSCTACNKTSAQLGIERQKALMTCSRCKKAHYCDKECQKTHWKAHKKFCKTAAAPIASTKPAHVTADGSGFMTFEDYMQTEGGAEMFSDPITAMMKDGALEEGWEDELGAAVNEAIEAGLMEGEEGGEEEQEQDQDQDES